LYRLGSLFLQKDSEKMADQTPDAMMYVGVEAIPGDIEKLLREVSGLTKAAAKNPVAVKFKISDEASAQATANVLMNKVISQTTKAYGEFRKIGVEAKKAEQMVENIINEGFSAIIASTKTKGGPLANAIESAVFQGLLEGVTRAESKFAASQSSAMGRAGKQSSSYGAMQNKEIQNYEKQGKKLREDQRKRESQDAAAARARVQVVQIDPELEYMGRRQKEMEAKSREIEQIQIRAEREHEKRIVADRRREQKSATSVFSKSSIKNAVAGLTERKDLVGEDLFQEAKKLRAEIESKAKSHYGKGSAGHMEVRALLRKAFAGILESRSSYDPESENAIARDILKHIGGPGNASVSDRAIRGGLEVSLGQIRNTRRELKKEMSSASGPSESQEIKEQLFDNERQDVEINRRLRRLKELADERLRIQEQLKTVRGKMFGGIRERMLSRNLEKNLAEREQIRGGGSMAGKTSAHGAQFAAMNAAYGFQDFFQVLAQPGMGPGRAFLAAANNIGPALGAVSSSVGPTVAIGAVMAAMAGLQFVMQKSEDTLRKNKESADRLAESFKRLAVSAAQIGRSLPLGSQTGMGGAMEMQNAILGRAPMAGAMLNGMQARSMESERTRASSGMGFWGSTGRYWGDMFSRVGTDKSPSAVKQHLFGRIKSQDEIPSMVGGGRDFDVKFNEKTGQMVRRPTAERDKMVAEYEAAMLERQKQRKAMEESGDTALIEQEYLRSQEAMSQLGQMKKFSKGIGSRSRSGFQEALSDSRKFGDKGIATGYVQNLYGEMQQSAMSAKRAKQNLQFLEENEPARAGQLRTQLSSLSGKQDALNKAGRGGEAEIVGQEIIDVKNQLMAFDNELKEAKESVAVFSQVATETEAAFMSIASNYKKGIRDAGESGKTTTIQSSDLWSRIQDSLTGNDVERQQLSVLEKILSAISTKEKLGSLKIGSLEGNDAGGYAGGGKKPSARDTILAKLREGEVVLTPEHQARLAQRLKMSPADLFGGMGMTHKGSSLSAWANVGGFDGGGLVGGMRFSSMLDGGFRKWQKRQDAQRNYANRQWGKWDDEEPFRDRYSQYKTQSGRLGMSAFYRNQGVPLYGRGAGGQGGRTLSGPKPPSFDEAWPGGMPFISAPGTALNLPRSGKSYDSFEEAMKQRTYRETMHQIRGVGATGHESSVSAANAMQLAEMKRRGMSSRSVDVMAGVQAGSAERAAEARRQQAMVVQRQAEQAARKGEFQEKAKADEQERLARKSAAQKEAAEKTERAKADYKKRLEEAKAAVKSGKGFDGGEGEDPEAKAARLEAGRERLRKKADEKWAPKEEYVPPSSHYAGESKQKNRKETLGEKLVRENEERFSKFEKENPSSGGGPGSSAGMTPGEKALKDQKDRLNQWRGGLGSRMEESFPVFHGEIGDTPPESSRTVRGGDRLGRWRAGQEDDKKMREEGNRLQMDAYKKHYDELPQKLMQNVSGQEQAASGVGFGGNDRNTAVLERIAETLITSSRDSVKASDKVVSAIEGSGISIS